MSTPRRSSSSRRALAAALLLSLVLAPAARADEGGRRTQADDVFTVSFVCSLVAAASAVPFMIANGVLAGRGRRPALAWRLGGWISAGLTIACGATAAVAYAKSGGDIGTIFVPPTLVVEGLIAGTTIGMTAWATTRPTVRVALSPPREGGGLVVSLGGRF